MQQISKFRYLKISQSIKKYSQVIFLPQISMQMNFSLYFLCLFDLKPLFVILTVFQRLLESE